MELLDLIDRGLLGEVDGLRDCTRYKGLNSTHHGYVTHVANGVVTHGASKYWKVINVERWRTEDCLVLVDVLDNCVDLCRGVSQTLE
ncbi:unannotated protein [freshwater metagenome]|uniref:Unannotated protein n=1 Tax=freshwater metagenome TaxID=449393 RepID=A0A6J6X1V1_9ZZZZ